MPEHQTRDTVAVSAWCNTCGKKTMHQVSDRRRGTCLEHDAGGSEEGLSRKQAAERKRLEKEEREPKLF